MKQEVKSVRIRSYCYELKILRWIKSWISGELEHVRLLPILADSRSRLFDSSYILDVEFDRLYPIRPEPEIHIYILSIRTPLLNGPVLSDVSSRTPPYRRGLRSVRFHACLAPSLGSHVFRPREYGRSQWMRFLTNYWRICWNNEIYKIYTFENVIKAESSFSLILFKYFDIQTIMLSE